MTDTQNEQIFDTLFYERKSVRAFSEKPVPVALIVRILELASQAPSGGNMQPWQVHVLTGATKDKLSQALKSAYSAKPSQAKDDYAYYPRETLQPYTDRIKKAGEDLYACVGIARRDIAARRRQQMRNYEFHGAPVGLILTMDRKLEAGSYVDMGIYISHILLAAQALGLASCAAASFISYADVVRKVLKLPSEQKVVCGVALGYEDKEHPLNKRTRVRADLSEYVAWHVAENDQEPD
ncbi:nitroreductase [Sneathiella glossodoripedis]|uniref:nitroreductase n=1 Tax=Sneathiella glossodoripedis TaxID=418853 RepID=UPI000470E904|nr:nitroreductase [Sneathiella glossodoripedis]